MALDGAFLRIWVAIVDDQDAFAALVFPELDVAFDLGDIGGIFRVASLEELGDARQTARDIARLRLLKRSLGQLFTR